MVFPASALEGSNAVFFGNCTASRTVLQAGEADPD